MLIWKEQFATGSETIDEQHRQLIRRINWLESLLVYTNPTLEQVANIVEFLEFLENYIDFHFQHEEECMLRHHCPAHQINLDAHENFKQLYKRIKNRSKKEGFHKELLVEINLTVNTWIQDHILRIDTQLKPCVSKQS